jgi:hypothetical protein
LEGYVLCGISTLLEEKNSLCPREHLQTISLLPTTLIFALTSSKEIVYLCRDYYETF